MECSKCGRLMLPLGNISGIILTSFPPCWDEVYICTICKVKKTERVHGKFPTQQFDLSDYEELT